MIIRGPKHSRVYLKRPTQSDGAHFISMVQNSRALHHPWSYPPADRQNYASYLKRTKTDSFCALLVCRTSDDALVGVFNISQIFRGNFQSAYLGYFANAHLAGQGYMSEGLRLVIRYAFGVLKLHRIEANIQPENHASIALVKRAGFSKEGFSAKYLKVGGRWRDHERWALLAKR